MKNNLLRIIGGKWRGRRVHFESAPSLRPTPDRVRETVFNWLQHDIIDARCLDLFAGSGALGIEALSRGAKHVDFVDNNRHVVQALKKVLQGFDTPPAKVHQRAAQQFLGQAEHEQYDLIFLDPPYHSDLLAKSLPLLLENNWLAPDGFIYFEYSKNQAVTLPETLEIHRKKQASDVVFGLALPQNTD